MSVNGDWDGIQLVDSVDILSIYTEFLSYSEYSCKILFSHIFNKWNENKLRLPYILMCM